MSVVKAQMVVISYAVTMLDRMNVSVMLATDLALMVSPVLVCSLTLSVYVDD